MFVIVTVVVLAALALSATTHTVLLTARDGYGRIPTRRLG